VPSRKSRWISSPAVHVRRPRLGYESYAAGPGAQRGRRCWSPPGPGPAAGHALISLLVLKGLLVYTAAGADIEALGLQRGHRTLPSCARAARRSSSRSRPYCPGDRPRHRGRLRRPDLAHRWQCPAGPSRCQAHRALGGKPGRDRQARRAAHCSARSLLPRSTQVSRCGMFKELPSTSSESVRCLGAGEGVLIRRIRAWPSPPCDPWVLHEPSATPGSAGRSRPERVHGLVCRAEVLWRLAGLIGQDGMPAASAPADAGGLLPRRAA
jgi:hypothetical protein